MSNQSGAKKCIACPSVAVFNAKTGGSLFCKQCGDAYARCNAKAEGDLEYLLRWVVNRLNRFSKKSDPRTLGPFADALRVLCGGKTPPKFTHGLYRAPQDDELHHKLQDWCAYNCVPRWGTGFGVIEAAELIVSCAVQNGNIRPEESEEP